MARAFDPAALDGEAETSAVLAVRFARKASMGLDTFAELIGSARHLPPPRTLKREPPPPACEVLMRVGQYRGWTLGEIAREDIRYTRWVASNFNDEDIRDAAWQVLDYFCGREAA